MRKHLLLTKLVLALLFEVLHDTCLLLGKNLVLLDPVLGVSGLSDLAGSVLGFVHDDVSHPVDSSGGLLGVHCRNGCRCEIL